MRNSTLIQVGHRTVLVRRLSSVHSRFFGEIDRPLVQQLQQRIHNVPRNGGGRIRPCPHRCFFSTSSLEKLEDDDHHYYHRHEEEDIIDEKENPGHVEAPKNPASPAEAKAPQLEEINGEISTPPFDRHSFFAALTACVEASKRGDPNAAERAEALLEKLKASSKVPVDARTYATVLGIWTRSRSKNKAAKRSLALLQEMEDLYQKNGHKHYKPDAICYQAVIGILTKSQLPARYAEQVWGRMQTMGYAPNLLTCNPVLNCWAKSGHPLAGKQAQAILKKMSVAPDVVSYNTVLQAYARAGDADSCLEILRQLMQDNTNRGIRPNTRTFTAVLAALSRSGSPTAPEQSEALLIRMQDLHDASADYDTKPNTISYNAVLNCWARQSQDPGAGARAENILHGMKELDLAGDVDVKPTIVSYNTVLHAYASSGGADAVARSHALVQEMMQSGEPQLAPNASTYNTLLKTILTATSSRRQHLNGDGDSKEQRAAEKLRNFMEQRGFSKTPKAAADTSEVKSSHMATKKRGKLASSKRVKESCKE
jgi:pentatricopeptide repeat protein